MTRHNPWKQRIKEFFSSWLVSPAELRSYGVLGMNARNIRYIAHYNDRTRYPVVDDKFKTKLAARKANIPVPELLATMDSQAGRKALLHTIEQCEKFVIKPARGSGGKGILVINGRDGDLYVKPSGVRVTTEDVLRHASNILSGLYSLGGKPDRVLVEAMIDFDPALADYSFEGVPDIRIIVFRGFPVMAMLRCSTHASDGKANLHQGAVGVGVDLASGRAIHAVRHGYRVDRHPDTEMPFDKLVVPDWSRVIRLAASCYEMTGLGYLGCDIVLDRKRGPLLLEANARPGLAIQIANGGGLRGRLKMIESLEPEQFEKNVEERVRYSQLIF
ncbi:alpha-L-glutamate ligase-like protein [Biformimicrobium ophioploci]|uniref:Alpha-L-glutamate ligase-like protein n=1 Tax=Biformimicrobium ophioploci TaxID=3036711 RepID=A0ABQ6LZ93_9GAMM|nr:alpha-L-glutamate ligase-like protein [Microbulbifer sp. NKW57]GMG87379.1 alpha-L-glutamate ligase-like protein [Microbulbifer sp. NKW57]